MFKHGDFFDSINKFTLSFKDPELEARYCESRRKHLQGLNAGKIVIIFVSLILSGLFSYTIYMYHQLGNLDAERQVIIVTVVLSVTWIFEFILHCIPCLHFLVGFPLIIMFCWVVVEVSTITLPSFALVPGAISNFLLILFTGVFHSKNWMFAAIAQASGFTIISVLAWQNYVNKMDNIRLITVEINMNLGLLLNVFICRYIETQQRMTVFAQWQTDRV